MRGPTLLICTVGGTPEAAAAAVFGCKPERVVFIVSQETKPDVVASILPLVNADGDVLRIGQCDIVQVPDAQDLQGCVECIRGIGSRVREWTDPGPDHAVMVDITGGTKCMAAALALVARTWRCRFSYVGGEARNKGGRGSRRQRNGAVPAHRQPLGQPGLPGDRGSSGAF